MQYNAYHSPNIYLSLVLYAYKETRKGNMNLMYTCLETSHSYRVRLEKYGALGNGLNVHIFCNE